MKIYKKYEIFQLQNRTHFDIKQIQIASTRFIYMHRSLFSLFQENVLMIGPFKVNLRRIFHYIFVLFCFIFFFSLRAGHIYRPQFSDRLTECTLVTIHTLRVHYAHAAANLNSGYSKYAKVARVHYFCTIALRISRAVVTRAWASRRVDLRERKVDSFSKRVIMFCW